MRSAMPCKGLRTHTACSKGRRRGRARLAEAETNTVATKLDLAAARVNLLVVEVDLEVANPNSLTAELVLVLANFNSATEELVLVVLEEAVGALSTRLCALRVSCVCHKVHQTMAHDRFVLAYIHEPT